MSEPEQQADTERQRAMGKKDPVGGKSRRSNQSRARAARRTPSEYPYGTTRFDGEGERR